MYLRLVTVKNNGADIFCDHIHSCKHVYEKQAAFIAGWLIVYIDKIN